MGVPTSNVLEHKISNEISCGSCDHRPSAEPVEVVTPSGRNSTYTITKISR